MTNYVEKYGLKGQPKIEQFINARGNPQANHFVIKFDNGEVFQSYDSIIAVETFSNHDNTRQNKVYLGRHYNYSTTTSKHLNHWLGMDSKARNKHIKQGDYIQLDEDLI